MGLDQTNNRPERELAKAVGARAEIDRLKEQIKRGAQDPINLTDLADRVLPPPDFVLGDKLGLLRHTAGVLSGRGGTGKGFLLQGLAISVACEEADIPFFGLEQFAAPPTRGRVVLLLAEDPKEALEHRMQPLLRFVRRTYGEKALRSIAANVVIESLQGQAPCLVGRDGDADSPLCRAWQETVMEKVHRARLFALDTFSRFHRANENDNGEMTVAIEVCHRVAMESEGAGLLPHHASKIDPEGARGASAITDSARWACNITQDKGDENKVSCKVWKQSYIKPTDRFRLRRGPGGMLLPIDPAHHDTSRATSVARARPSAGRILYEE
jgi:hypothetical protein